MSTNLQTILSPISADMQSLNEVIRHRLSSEVALINQISGYIIEAGGKRIRPALLLLTAKAIANGQALKHHLDMAAVVEFIHTATLLHDDVVDESDLRRGRATANAAFGNAASVLVGDFLYSRAFQMMVAPNELKIMQILADATNTIAEGEVLQLMNMHDPDVNEERYLQVIHYKTGKLFEASSALGALLAKSTPEQYTAAEAYGRHIGTAFQLVDDILDYTADAAQMGKNAGDDLREGKRTVLMAMTLDALSEEGKRELLAHLGQPDISAAKIEELRALIKSSGAVEKVENLIEKLTNDSLTAIEDPSIHPSSREFLTYIALSAVKRSA